RAGAESGTLPRCDFVVWRPRAHEDPAQVGALRSAVTALNPGYVVEECARCIECDQRPAGSCAHSVYAVRVAESDVPAMMRLGWTPGLDRPGLSCERHRDAIVCPGPW